MSGREAAWHETELARADRRRVHHAVERLAQLRLRFTADDVRAHTASADGVRLGLALAEPAQLWRHLDALVHTGVLTVVGKRLAWAYPPDAGDALRKLRRMYVLRSHLHQHEHTLRDYDDRERAYLALCVACAVSEDGTAATSAVTTVATCIPDLALDATCTTRSWLDGLAKLDVPLVGITRVARWTRWRPLGQLPDDPRFDGWVAAVRDQLAKHADPAGIGAATRNEVVRDLVLRTMQAQAHRITWPHGRAVTAREVQLHVARHPELAVKAAVLKLDARGIGPVLGDASRTRVAGQARKTPVITKVGAPPGRQPYYDVPDHPGSDARRLVVAVEALNATVHRNLYRRLLREADAAGSLIGAGRRADPASSAAVLGAIGAVRLVALFRELDGAQAQADGLLATGHLLGRQTLDAVGERATLLRELRAELARRSGGITNALQAAAEADHALEPLGVVLAAVEAAPRRILTAAEVLALRPFAAVAASERTAAALLADMKELQRHPLPATAAGAPRRGGPTSTGVDRVDAFMYLAKRSASRSQLFLRSGADLLGPTLRDPSLPVLLLTRAATERPSRDATARWRAALAALILLDDPQAPSAASAELASGSTHAGTEVALWTLVLTRRLQPHALPRRIREDPTPAVRAAVNAATTAAKLGRVFP